MLLQVLAIVNCAAMNTGVHRFFWIGVSGFLGYNPSSGIAVFDHKNLALHHLFGPISSVVPFLTEVQPHWLPCCSSKMHMTISESLYPLSCA